MKREELEQLARDPLNPENAAAAARVYSDGSLWPACERALYPDAEPTEDERRAIDRVVAERCGARRRGLDAALAVFVAERLRRMAEDMGDFALAASAHSTGARPRGETRDAEDVTFVFVSDEAGAEAEKSLSWRAELTLPPDARAETLLAIDLKDATGAPVDGGFFRVAGVALPVAKGRAEIPYGLFLTGLKDARVERTTPEGVRLPGALALF